MDAKEISEIVKNCAQAAAVVGAGLYFIKKMVEGFEAIDTSLSAKAERSPSSGGNDHLAVSITLKRGTRGTLCLHDAEVVVAQNGSTEVLKPDIRRLGFDDESSPRKIERNKQFKNVPTLDLAPGQEATFSIWCQVKRDDPCSVDATVIGTKLGSLVMEQWRTSVISLPTQVPPKQP